MKMILVAVVALLGGVALADLYWSGQGEDGRWDAPANWSMNAGLTSPANRCPSSSDVVWFVLDTFDHDIVVTVPDGSASGVIKVKDSTAAARLKLIGEPLPGNTRAAFTTSGINFQSTTITSGMTVELENFAFADGSKFCNGVSIVNSRQVLKNCFFATTAEFLPSSQAGTQLAFVDSDLTFSSSFKRVNNPNPDFVMAITNTTLVTKNVFQLCGPSAKIDIVDSDLTASTALQFGYTADRDTDMKVRIANTTIHCRAQSFITLTGHNNELVLDHVDSSDASVALNCIGYNGDNQTTRLINSDVYFGNGTPSPKGTIYLEDSIWAVTNNVKSNGAAAPRTPHFVISGKRSRMIPGNGWQNGPVKYDFIVPQGGYDLPPVGVDGVLRTGKSAFFSSISDCEVNVLPKSPAARMEGTGIYPLFYYYEASGAKELNLSGLPPMQLPNAESEYLAVKDSKTAFDQVMSQSEDWWAYQLPNAVATESYAGLAVKIVGRDVRRPIVAGFAYSGLDGDNLAFSLNLSDLGETVAGALAQSVTPTILARKVGEAEWRRFVNSAVAATGESVLLVDKANFSDGAYELGVRLENDVEGVAEYMLEKPVEISFSKATVSELGYVGEGVEATISGTVTGTGGADALAAVLEVSEAEDFSVIKATYELGALAPGAAFEKTVVVDPEVTSYFRVTVGEGAAKAAATVSGVPRTVATIGTIQTANTNGLCRVVVDGSVVARGAGVSTVKLRYSMDGVTWSTNTVGTVSADGESFSGECSYPMPGGTAYYEVLVENTSGEYTWVAEGGVQTMPVKDYSTYYWRAVDGEWSGDWTDGRHWYKPEFPDDVTLYPQSADSTANFDACPAQAEAIAIVLPQNVAIKAVESSTEGQRLRFAGDAESKLTTTLALMQPHSQNVFSCLQVASAAGLSISATDVGYAFEDGATVTLPGFVPSSGASATLTVGVGCSVTLSANDVTLSGGTANFIIDNGTLKFNGFLGTDEEGNGAMAFTLKGADARLRFTRSSSKLWRGFGAIRFIFEIPVGGYHATPVELTSGTGSFLPFSNQNIVKTNFCVGGDDYGLIYRVADNSPALLNPVRETFDQDLFVWNKTGFARGHVDNDPTAVEYDILDYTKLQVPTVNSDGNRVRRFALKLRGIDDIEYATPAAVKAAGTTAYAVGFHQEKTCGLAVLLK